MYKNGSGINIDKLSESQDTTFKNGLEVIISIRTRSYDLAESLTKLVLFEKLHIELIDKFNSNYNNYYYNSLMSQIKSFNTRKVVHFKTFSIVNCIDHGRWLKVGNILYRNDIWDSLETTSGIIINIPIGEVDITPNREELQFTERTKNTIRKYISKVKEELQELVDIIETRNFTLSEFYQYISNVDIKYEKDGVPIYINSRDVTVDTSKITINGEQIPSNFDYFVRCLRTKLIDKEDTYKIFNCGGYYHYRRLVKDNIQFDCILDENVFLGYKEDSIIKSVTASYYEEQVGDKCVVVVYDLEKQKKDIRTYLGGETLNLQVRDTCIDFLFKMLKLYPLSNSRVPQSYVDSFKASKKKKDKTREDGTIPIRYYRGATYIMSTLNQLPDTGLTIYSKNTRTTDIISALSSVLSCIPNVRVITLAKEYFPILESNRKYVLLEDFLEFPNKIFKKIVTAKIISHTYNTILSSFGTENQRFYKNGYCYSEDILRNLPIIKEFNTKYKPYIKASINITNSNISDLNAIIDKYEIKGWYNKADVEYFSISSEEQEAIKTILNMERDKSDIIKCIAFFMFGNMHKIGLGKPKINVNKYLKKFKHECI